MEFLFIIIGLIIASIGIYFVMEKINNSNSKSNRRSNIETFRVKGTARGAIGRVESSEMLEYRREKVNQARSKF